MPTSLRIRMYRTGFGDCFLLSFGAAASARHILIDFGVHQDGDIGTMEAVMDDLEKTTGRKLALVVASHAHRDHISGFGQFADRFEQFEIGDVWMPWTDNPKDKDAAIFERKQLALYERLEQHLRLAAAANPNPEKYAAAMAAVHNLRGNGNAKSELARAFGSGVKPKYFAAGASVPKVAGIAGLSAEILAPSRKKEFFGREMPPANQRFLTEAGGEVNAVHPFPDLEIRAGAEIGALVAAGQPTLPQAELDEMHEMSETSADRLALTLEKVRNNTSLVILFRFHGRTLLFPGDAQWGSWQSWCLTPEAASLLAGVDFLKVGHHGSENATPVSVVNALKSNVTAMVPTQTVPFPTIPRMPLLNELAKHCGTAQTVVRSDWIEVAKAPRGPKPKGNLPKGIKQGELWIDYRITP